MSQRPPRLLSGAEPAAPVSRQEPAAALEPVAPAGPASPVERVVEAKAVEALQGAEAVERAGRSELVRAIARRLRSGEITVQQAVEELIEEAVRTSLAGVNPEGPLARQLRAVLRSYVEEDPYLSARLHGLERKS
ncbi:MAG: hypothetical protein RMK29_00460 [Myxococcales bacterium]|nr:hypothetical protein [Myxococcota bacterium]MDW8280148.1 hypothetical protein [Myxococcales bacterium]